MNFYSILLFFMFSFGNGEALYTANGKATYYADRLHGQRTASGERYNKTQLTAAHRTLPFNTYVEVTNLTNGKTVIVKVNDRLPKNSLAIIDLSRAAAKEIDLLRAGVAKVTIKEVLPEAAQQAEPITVTEVPADKTR